MSARTRDREQFQATLARNFPDKPTVTVARMLLRNAATHQRLQEESCNGHPAQGNPHIDSKTIGKWQDKWDARIEKQTEQCERRIIGLAKDLGAGVEFQGDPRGWTVKLLVNGNTVGVPV